jgi:cytidine deaminase
MSRPSEAEVAALCAAAREAAGRAYAPYSRFPVGAAVLGAAGTYLGANIENASYGLGLCAERAALSAAVLAGDPGVRAIAVACVAAGPGQDGAELMPCGACRQWMVEHAAPDLDVIVCGPGDGVLRYTLDELMPRPFRLSGRPATGGAGHRPGHPGR